MYTHADSKATHTHTHTGPVSLQVWIVWVRLCADVRCTSSCSSAERGIQSGGAYGHTAQTINRLQGSSARTHLHTPTQPYLFTRTLSSPSN